MHTPTESQYSLSAKRLCALMGDTMHDFPPHFIERLERQLEEFETSLTNAHVVLHPQAGPDNGRDAQQDTRRQE